MINNYDKLSNKAKELFSEIDNVLEKADHHSGISGEDYLFFMQEIIDEATQRYNHHEILMDRSL
jgi:hypothetical protein